MTPSFNRLTKALAKTIGISQEELLQSFKPATEADIPLLIEFRKNFLPDNLNWSDHDYLLWRYDFSETTNKATNRYWVLKVNSEILGTLGVESFELMVSGKKIPAYHPLDLMSKPSMDGIGIGAWLNLAIKEKYSPIVVIGSSDQARSLVNRIYHSLPDYTEWKYFISIRGSLKRKLKIPLLADFLALVWDSYSAIRRQLKFGSNVKVENGVVRNIEHFPKQVNKMAENFNIAEIFRFRSSEYLNWRFIDNPCTDYKALGIFNGDELVAYSIYHILYSSTNKQYEAQIDDIFWNSAKNNSNEAKIIKDMVFATINEAKNKKARVIQISIYSPRLATMLPALGFLSRGERSVFAVFDKDEQLAEQLYNEEIWYLTEGDAHDEGY